MVIFYSTEIHRFSTRIKGIGSVYQPIPPLVLILCFEKSKLKMSKIKITKHHSFVFSICQLLKPNRSTPTLTLTPTLSHHLKKKIMQFLRFHTTVVHISQISQLILSQHFSISSLSQFNYFIFDDSLLFFLFHIFIFDNFQLGFLTAESPLSPKISSCL